MSISDIDERIPNDELKDMARKQEPAFLSILLKDKDSLMDTASFGIKEEHFWDPTCRFFYSIILKNYRQYNSLLTRTVMHNIMDMGESQGLTEERKAAYKSYWDTIYNMESSDEDYEFLRKCINDRYLQWQSYKILNSHIEEVVNTTVNQGVMVQKIQDEMNQIDNIDPDAYTMAISMDKALDESMTYINHRRDHPKDIEGVLCGINAIDNIFYGFDRPSYTVITGFINGGKSTLMFNLAFNMAKLGYSVVYVTMESAAVPLNTRILSLHAMVDFNRIKRGGKDQWGLSNQVHEILMGAYNDLKQNIKPNFEYIQLLPQTKVSKVISEIDKVRSRKRVDVVFVDYLQVIGFETHHSSRPDLDLAFTSQRLQGYTKKNKLVMFTALQLKNKSAKEIRKNTEKKTADEDIHSLAISTEDLSGSQMITADADNVIGAVKNRADKPDKLIISITKGRNAESGRLFPLDFDGPVGRVSDPDLAPGQLQAINDVIYNTNITKERIESDDDLFKNGGTDRAANAGDEPIVEEKPEPEKPVTELKTEPEKPKPVEPSAPVVTKPPITDSFDIDFDNEEKIASAATGVSFADNQTTDVSNVIGDESEVPEEVTDDFSDDFGLGK
jgi:replicative DNA helicase